MIDTRAKDLLPFRRRTAPDRVLVVGGGLAGLFTALRLAPLPVTVLTPKPLGEGSSSAWAQGGIAAAIGAGDDADSHAADTIAAGAGLTDPEVARVVTSEAGDRIRDLLSFGVPFDRELDGKLRLSQEAAHSARRIVRVDGDRAGKAVMAALIATVAKTPSISVLENVEAVELVKRDGRLIGLYATRSGSHGRASFLAGRAVVLATGGIGQLFRVTTNPAEARGGGLAMAARVGAIIADPEFVQFHPTAFDVSRDPAPLASEAIRGDGGRLVNREGERFMLAIDPRGELAPRDVVARGVHREIAAGRGAFLDVRALDLARSFPTAYEVCTEAGIDPAKQPIPIAPAAHYHMGGVSTDMRGRTSLTGLWACGEVACTGLHGANRLASNSLLEAVVFAARVADDIAADAPHWPAMGDIEAPETIAVPVVEPAEEARLLKRLREVMASHVGVERTAATLKAALQSVVDISRVATSPALANMAASAILIAAAAHERKESRGAHCRLDFPSAKERGRHTFMTLTDAIGIAARVTGKSAFDAEDARAVRTRAADLAG
ncbi:L-aspartate oxidase [Rhodomicrobium vannielii ATCC 17100]|uniref:L-aspartate oxidase n=1 Tax=Rhodomicrobium vannielii TaxID=1069 RepID=UPI0019198657|nr:L-aspartate oxidase [Rhodomicrobium vannielii]MBJ7534640.1 L-aspartate oxidase [Rhodomicrobium vannielii ATCC 17100]